MPVAWCLSVVLALFSRQTEAEPFRLHIGGFFGVDVGKDGAWSSAGAIPAVQMALEHVNNNTDVLAGFSLGYIWRDSKARHTHHFLFYL